MLENVLTAGKAKRFYLRKKNIRVGVSLIGNKNGSNHTFTTPEKFVQLLGNGTKIVVYRNGHRDNLLDNYYVSESGGVGSGYDTVIFIKPPRVFESLICDYTIDDTNVLC